MRNYPLPARATRATRRYLAARTLAPLTLPEQAAYYGQLYSRCVAAILAGRQAEQGFAGEYA